MFQFIRSQPKYNTLIFQSVKLEKFNGRFYCTFQWLLCKIIIFASY
nr:MAG TPA: hypothetical protein [Bacteriophage sp.]